MKKVPNKLDNCIDGNEAGVRLICGHTMCYWCINNQWEQISNAVKANITCEVCGGIPSKIGNAISKLLDYAIISCGCKVQLVKIKEPAFENKGKPSVYLV